MENATQEAAAMAETYVFWDIKRFPVPPDFDARLVRPCIKRLLKKHGYGAPLTIFAVGILTDVHDDTLRALSSAGISLLYDIYGIHTMMRMKMYEIQPPANFVCLSQPTPNPPKFKSGFNILMPFSYYDPEEYTTILWESSILPGALEEEETCSETGEFACWCCSLCKVRGQGFERFTSHISSREHARKRLNNLSVRNFKRAEKLEGEDMHPFDVVKRNQPKKLNSLPFHYCILEEEDMFHDNMVVKNQPEEVVAGAVTSVFWDIKSFPVPSGFDARLVRPCIKRFLEKYGYYGPLTVYAVGMLTDVHDDILRDLSSTGISLHYAPYGPTDIMLQWVIQNEPPANILGLIDPRRIPPLHKRGYNIFNPFSFISHVDGTFLWERTILAGAHEEDTCSETGSWYCLICDVRGHSFESFTWHFSSREHIYMRFDCLSSKDNKNADKFDGEDIYPFDVVVRNQPKKVHVAPTKQPKGGEWKTQKTLNRMKEEDEEKEKRAILIC